MGNATDILITGASGLLGANLAICAQQHSFNAVGVYHRHKFRLSGVRAVQADLRDALVVRDLLRDVRPLWVVHSAALTNVDLCEEEPELARQINERVTRNLVESGREFQARIVHISTDAVFDGGKGEYSEEDTPNPINVYATTKLAAENTVRNDSSDHLIIRTGIYGWNMQDKLSLAEWILQSLEKGTAIPGFKNVFFSPILVNDLSVFIMQMISLRLKGLYHVSGSEACSKFDFALKLADIFGLDSRLVQPAGVEDVPLKAPRPKNVSLQTGKISQALGTAMPDVNAGLLRFKELRDSGFVEKLKAMKG